MREETLPGGNMDGAVLIGDVVHKQASPWTPTVHALLRHLEQAGVDGVPRVLGFDEQGRQMLTYLPGEVIGDRDPWPAWVYADSTLVQVGQWIRRVHDATADFVPPTDERWFTGRTMQPGWIVGHQDAAPYNAVMDGGRLAGFFDWDIASPSPREEDLGFSALLWVPLTAPDAGEQSGPDDVRDSARRLHLLLDTPTATTATAGPSAPRSSSVPAGRQASSAAWLTPAIRPRSRCCPSQTVSSSPRPTSKRCRAASGRLSAGSAGGRLITRRWSLR
jgi:hypothetical protein